MKPLDEFLNEIDLLKKQLDEYRPLSEAQLRNINAALDVEYTYDSNRIEGNTLTLQETALVIEKGITVAGKNLREYLEAINHFDAIGFIKQVTDSNEPFDERTLKDIHALILRSIDKEMAGAYRTVNVKISGSRHLPPDALHVSQLMEEYFDWYNQQKDKLHPVLLAAHLHEKLVTIHPFIDGNGRTARLVMNLILIRNSYVIANIAGDGASRLNYYNALEKCQTENSCDDFHLLVAKAEWNALNAFVKLVKTGNGKPAL